jgi:hypothetical protein
VCVNYRGGGFKTYYIQKVGFIVLVYVYIYIYICILLTLLVVFGAYLRLQHVACVAVEGALLEILHYFEEVVHAAGGGGGWGGGLISMKGYVNW